jgi:hypothetical protein
MEGQYCRLYFRVRCETQLGQTVGITGSSYSLGGDISKIIIP